MSPRRKDYFYDYLTYCEDTEAISPGEFLEKVEGVDSTTTFTILTCDLIDTFRAGKLLRIKLPNGGAAYVRKIRTLSTQ